MNDANRILAEHSRVSLFARLHARAGLAIDGLPPALATLAAAHAHVVYAEPSPARDALFWQTAAGALRGPATVLSTRRPDEIAATLRTHGLDIDVGGALHHKANLCTLRPLPERPGIDVLVEAMQALVDQTGARGTPFLVEGVDAFFSWGDGGGLSREGARLAEWCARQRCGLLLVVAPPPIDEHRPPTELQGFHGRFSGAAQLSQLQGQYMWEVAFWRDREAVVASESLPLRFSAHDNRLIVAADTFTDAPGEAGLLAPDEQRVIASRDAVVRERWVPGHWQVVDTNEAAVATAQPAVAATVILHYGGSRALETLAEQVHQLRRHCGKALKIVVREDEEVMRQHYELLMLNLGANLVIARRTPFARVEAMLDAIQGQLFSRPILADYKTALSAVLTGSASGYVPPAEFIELVRTAVDRSRLIRLPHVLLRLPLLPEIAHVDALRACQMRRAGDICTAGRDCVYVFFFACRLDDVDAVCGRVFRRSLADLFEGELRSGDADSIVAVLDAFANDIAGYAPPDYSGWLERHAAEAVTAASPAPTPAAEPMPDPPSSALTDVALPPLQTLSPRPGHRSAPRRAPQPHAVPLKTHE